MNDFLLKQCPTKRRKAKPDARFRAALSTLELLVSISIASVLTLGLSSAIFVAGRSLQVPEQSTETKLVVGEDYGRLREALSEAIELPASTNQRVELIVPDRTGDGANDRIVYSIAKNDLTEQINDATPQVIGRNIESLEMLSPTLPGSEVPFKQARFVNSSATSGRNTRHGAAFFPSGSMIGDMLVLVVATSEVVNIPSTTPNNWNLISSQSGINGTLTAWYKFMEPSEGAVIVSLGRNTDVVTSVLQFQNVSVATPICSRDSKSESFTLGGLPSNPPSVTLPAHGGLALQLLTTRRTAIANQMSGLSAHMTCFYGEADDLALVCSTHQAGARSGVFDAQNTYRFARDTNYIAIGVGLAAE